MLSFRCFTLFDRGFNGCVSFFVFAVARAALIPQGLV